MQRIFNKKIVLQIAECQPITQSGICTSKYQCDIAVTDVFLLFAKVQIKSRTNKKIDFFRRYVFFLNVRLYLQMFIDVWFFN